MAIGLDAAEEWLFPLIHFLIGVNVALFVTILVVAWRRNGMFNDQDIHIHFTDVLEPKLRGRKIHLLTVIGSGGHTTEMLKLMDSLGSRYSPRTYVIATTDRFGRKKVFQLIFS